MRSVNYEEDLEIGHCRAEEAAKAIRQWTGVQALAVCALRPTSNPDRCQPVGQLSWKEIVQDTGFRGAGGYYLLVVDEDGTAKACSKQTFPLCEILKLAKRLPLSARAKSSDPADSYLAKYTPGSF